jgi:hypothetical protein
MHRGSWKTSVLGYIILALDLLKLVGDAIKAEGMPTDMNGWIVFGAGLATGIGLILSKDYDKSNAPVPVAAATVSASSAAKPNPSELKPDPVPPVQP